MFNTDIAKGAQSPPPPIQRILCLKLCFISENVHIPMLALRLLTLKKMWTAIYYCYYYYCCCYRCSIRVAVRFRHCAAAWLKGSRVRIPLRTWMLASCVCCVLCVAAYATGWPLMQRALPAVCVCQNVCDLETSKLRRHRPESGSSSTEQKSQAYCCDVLFFAVCLCFWCWLHNC
jgi:hypothetical protein